jgi:tetratricopeptide (TPR) repeat protein/TolB-like protein
MFNSLQIRALSIFIGREAAEYFIGEFDELYVLKRHTKGYWRALTWYIKQIIFGIAPLFRLWQRPAEAVTLRLLPDAGASRNALNVRVFDFYKRRPVLLALSVATLLAAAIEINGGSHFFTKLQQRPWLPVKGRPSIAVLGFSGSSGTAEATELADALTEMFRTEMSVDGRIRLISGEDVAQMRRDLSPPISGTLSKGSLKLIRKYLGADYLLIGFGPRIEGVNLRFDVKIEDTRNGELVVSTAQTGTRSNLFSMVSNTGALLRKKLAGGLSAYSSIGALKASLPESEDARRLYIVGISRLRALDAPAALPILLRGATLDAGSPRIQAALTEAWSDLGYEKNAIETAKRTVQLASGLSPEERTVLEGRYSELMRNWSGAINSFHSLWTIYHDNLDYGIHLALAQSSAGKIDEAFTTVSEMRRLSSPLAEDPRIDLTEATVAEAKGDFPREHKAAESAASKANDRGASALFANARLRECWALNALGQQRKALEAAQAARDTFAKIGDRNGEARALKNVADVLDDIPDHQQARTAYDSALRIFREIGNLRGAAVTLNNLGYTLRDQGELSEAQRSFEESAAISRKTGDDNLQAKALNGLAGVQWREGELTEASLMYQQAYEVFMSTGDLVDAATVSGNIAIILQQLGHLDKAQMRFEQSLQSARKLGDRESEARTLGNLGGLFLLKGDLEPARQRFEEQLSIGENGDRKQSAYAFVGLGQVAFEEGNLIGAKEKIEKAISIRIETGELGLVAEARFALAQVLLELGDTAGAESAGREAADQFRKENETDDQASATALLAQSVAERGRPEEARALIEGAMKQALQSKDKATKVDVSLRYSRIHLADSPAGKVTATVRSTIEEAKRYGFLGYELEGRLILAELEQKSGNPEAGIHLKSLQNDAASHGFGLIERRAARQLEQLRSPH